MAERILLAVSTFPDAEVARRISNQLVSERFAACANIFASVESIYRWQEKIETSQEWLCQIKSRQSQFPAIEQAIREVHSYEVPEIVALQITAGSSDYLQWLSGEVPEN